MSAIPANVSSGLTKQTTPAITNSTPNSAHSQRSDSATAARTKFWTLASRNMRPTRTPIVVTEASSNCRRTRETISQAIPETSQTHQ